MVTILVAVGLVVALWRYRRDERARVLLFLFLVSLFLFFGRPTLGPVLRLLPGSGDLFLRRFVFEVHLVGLYLAELQGGHLRSDRAGAGSRFRPLRDRPVAIAVIGVAAAAAPSSHPASSNAPRGPRGEPNGSGSRRSPTRATRPTWPPWSTSHRGAWAGQVLRGDACQLGVVVCRRSGAGLRHAPEPGDRRRRFRQADVVALGTVRVPLHRYEPVALRPVRRAVPDPRRGKAAAGPGGAGGGARAPRALGDAGPELRRHRRRARRSQRTGRTWGCGGPTGSLGSPRPEGEPRRRLRGPSGANRR